MHQRREPLRVRSTNSQPQPPQVFTRTCQGEKRSPTAWSRMTASSKLAVLEVPLIPDNDLEALQSFNGHGSITLSAYLCLDTPERRESAYGEFVQQMKLRLEECIPKPECHEVLKEDMEIVGQSGDGSGNVL